MKTSTIILLLAFFSLPFTMQGQVGLKDLGFEFQAYPAGVIPGIRADLGVGDRLTVNARVGYNVTRRGDWGVHENEEGVGVGFSLGVRRYFREHHKGLFLGLRTDIWFLDIDWTDFVDSPLEVKGNSEVTVFQPTLEGGYCFLFSNENYAFAPSLSFGREINVNTNGAEVGQDFILLIGFMLTKRFGGK